jgi:protein-disulfide isomerase
VAEQGSGRRTTTRDCRLVCAAAIVLAGSALFAASQTAKSVSVDDDAILGDVNAKVTIVEFSDYQCEFCRIVWKNTLSQLREHCIDTGEVRLVFRDVPQSVHPEANVAALAAECAKDQGKYWEYHDKVFSEQDRRGREREVVRFKKNDLKKWAAEIGLEATEFDR